MFPMLKVSILLIPAPPPCLQGIEISKPMLESILSLNCTPFSEGPFNFCTTAFNTNFPKTNNSQHPFQYITFDVQHKGHMPPGVYTVPHIDFHFFLTPLAEVKKAFGPVPGVCSGLTKEAMYNANKPLPKACFPKGRWRNVNAVAPMQGNHLANMDSPENNHQSFTNTYIWGMFNGRLTYMEPMITLKYLEGLKPGAKECKTTSLPTEFPEANYYPAQYCTIKDAKTGAISVELIDFKYFPAGCKGKADTGFLTIPARKLPGCPTPEAEGLPLTPPPLL